jgi:hypothetical protein
MAISVEREAVSPLRSPMERRALTLWPRLDPEAVRRCAGDPLRIAGLVSLWTSLSIDVIVWMLTRPLVTPREIETWFG